MSARETVRFAVLCLGRTGSTHLVELLDSHPQVRCFGELLNPRHPEAAPGAWLGDVADEQLAHRLDAVLDSADMPAAGFKLPLDSLRARPEAERWLRERRALRVIRLRRENLLALLVSRRLLRETMLASPQAGYGQVTVEIDPDECLRVLARMERHESHLDSLSRGHRTFELEYNELNDANTHERVLAFLGQPTQPLASTRTRRRRQPLQETVSNWEQIRSALAGTRWAPFCEEAD